jgi:hypothetical protein
MRDAQGRWLPGPDPDRHRQALGFSLALAGGPPDNGPNYPAEQGKARRDANDPLRVYLWPKGHQLPRRKHRPKHLPPRRGERLLASFPPRVFTPLSVVSLAAS